jgi:uncharacterized protein (DUF1697 family)
MTRYVAFLRGINVGGHVVKMDQLAAQFESLGFDNVSTFIASGNVIFESPSKPGTLEPRIEQHLAGWLGYAVNTFLRSEKEIASIAAHQPFADPGGVYVLLLRSAPDAALRQRLLAPATEHELISVHEREVYLRLASFGDSPIPGLLGKILGAENTMRNANTLRRLAARFAAPAQTARRSRKASASPSTTRP